MNAPAAPVPLGRRMARPLTALAAVALPTAYVATVDPNAPGHYPVCPVLRATGWWCPGCGGLRCVHALTHGDLVAAGHDNVLVMVLAGVLAVLWLRWAWAALTDGRPPQVSMSGRRVALLIVVLVVFTVVRNLPGGAGFAPPRV